MAVVRRRGKLLTAGRRREVVCQLLSGEVKLAAIKGDAIGSKKSLRNFVII